MIEKQRRDKPNHREKEERRVDFSLSVSAFLLNLFENAVNTMFVTNYTLVEPLFEIALNCIR